MGPITVDIPRDAGCAQPQRLRRPDEAHAEWTPVVGSDLFEANGDGAELRAWGEHHARRGTAADLSHQPGEVTATHRRLAGGFGPREWGAVEVVNDGEASPTGLDDQRVRHVILAQG
ncbi:unannotated protein [freshwater metagenome]|uniref:Unannotated protein n=1 Tax=freshwater metagenome TaxID=449393 RepID=A0A6J7L3A7_9ZZZZ